MNPERFTPAEVKRLEANEVFVFGSNMAGRHGKGAALQARLFFGAVRGQGTGPMGQCYAIATKDRQMRVLPIEVIAEQIEEFLGYASLHPEKVFLVTRIGCGLAGYSPRDIASFFPADRLPLNVVLPEDFVRERPRL